MYSAKLGTPLTCSVKGVFSCKSATFWKAQAHVDQPANPGFEAPGFLETMSMGFGGVFPGDVFDS